MTNAEQNYWFGLVLWHINVGLAEVGSVGWGRTGALIVRTVWRQLGNWILDNKYKNNCCTAVFLDRPTQRASVAQGLFYGESGRRVVAHTRPAFAKNAYGPVGIPLIRGEQLLYCYWSPLMNLLYVYCMAISAYS